MHIHFSPIRMDTRPTLVVRGDALVIDGEIYDFEAIPEGATLPRTAVNSPWIVSDVMRLNGELHLTLLLPHGPTAPVETLFPVDLNSVADGTVPLPPHDGDEVTA